MSACQARWTCDVLRHTRKYADERAVSRMLEWAAQRCVASSGLLASASLLRFVSTLRVSLLRLTSAFPPPLPQDCVHAGDGTDALLRACESGMVPIALALATGGHGDPLRRDQNNGATALFWASAHEGMDGAVAALIERGADVEVRHAVLDRMELEAAPDDAAFSGATPLTVAAQHDHREAIVILLRGGADEAPRDANGETAQEILARVFDFDNWPSLVAQVDPW